MSLLRLFPVLSLTLFVLIPSALAESKKAQQAAGAVLFRDKGCAYCHGANAQGTAKAPSLANLRKTMSAARIAGQILDGGQKMPSFREALSDAEVTQLVQFLRAKRRPLAPPQPGSAIVSNPAQ